MYLAAMMNTVDCAHVPEGQRLAYWRETVAGLFPRAQVTMAKADGFEGSVRWRTLGPVTISEICSVAQCVTRSKEDVDNARADVFELNLQVKGEGLITQCGRDAVTQPGDFALYDSARPFAMQFDRGFKQLSLQMPQPALRQRVWNADAYTALAFSGRDGTGKALALLLEHCLIDRAALTQEAQAALAGTLMDVLGQCLIAQTNRLDQKSWGRRRTLRRLKDVLLNHISEPSFTPAQAAAHCGISLRYAHHLFEMEEQTLSRWLLLQRLNAAKRALHAPGNAQRTLADIAFSCGFTDAAHFSRTFKAQFGNAPSRLRVKTNKTALLD
ncbi:MAG: helix-turn-helix domain-containing protein [Pseudomonadota bacterium]